MIVGISGAQGTGKTTLLNSLRRSELIGRYRFRDEVTRWVKSLGVEINESGGNLTQSLIMMRHIYNLKMSGVNMISDRTMLDCLVYTRYLYENKQIDDSCMNEVQEAFNQTKNDYDVIFYVEPEVSLVDDGVRSTSENFRRRIIELFEVAIFEDLDDNVIRLRGTVEERTNQVLNRILYTI